MIGIASMLRIAETGTVSSAAVMNFVQMTSCPEHGAQVATMHGKSQGGF